MSTPSRPTSEPQDPLSAQLDPRTALIDRILWGLAGLSAALTAWFSLVGVPPGTSSISRVDKIQHFVAYLVTSALLFLAGVWRPGRGEGSLARYGAFLVVVLVLAAGVIELLQAVTGRDADPLDWIAGSVGIATAILLVAWWRRREDLTA